MKKIYIALAAVLALSAAASAEVGIGLKGGIFQQDNNLQSTFAFPAGSGKISDDNFFGGVEFIFQDYFAANSMIGFKIGGEYRAPLKMQNTMVGDELKNDAFTFPLTLYYKYAPPCTPFEFWIGGGVTAAYSKWTYNPNSLVSETTDSNVSVFPHLKAGVELRMTDHIGIGIDGGYNFSAKLKEDFVNTFGAQRDLTGFEGNIALRFYF
ncbi:MAG: outer membrane beta-barrel protein [Elusimicrobium sp.]|jgi:hypothetical protein|nr:outer membrane beta-barrel protein [Elusimicrobium sp.]